MWKKYEIVFLFLLSINFSCNSQSGTEDSININIYSSNMLGWTMPIPEDWEITQKNEIDAMKERGLEIIDKSNVTNLQKPEIQKQLSKSIYLLGFKKNKQNMFTALAEKYDTSAVKFDDQNRKIKELLCKSLTQAGIEIDTTWGRESIDNKEFITFSVVAKKENRSISQIYFNRQIDDYMLSIILLYDTEEIKDILLKHLRDSKFDK